MDNSGNCNYNTPNGFTNIGGLAKTKFVLLLMCVFCAHSPSKTSLGVVAKMANFATAFRCL